MKSKKVVLSVLSTMILSISLVSIKANATTVSSASGFARVDKVGSDIRWEVGPKTSWPYSFTGELNYSNGYMVTASGVGALGATTSGTAPAFGSGVMSVTLTGVAEAVNYTAFIVMPGCKLSYYA